MLGRVHVPADLRPELIDVLELLLAPEALNEVQSQPDTVEIDRQIKQISFDRQIVLPEGWSHADVDYRWSQLAVELRPTGIDPRGDEEGALGLEVGGREAERPPA